MKIIKRLKHEWIYLRRIRLTPKGLLIFLLVIKDSLKWCFDVNIGNFLRHDGKLFYVNNGVKLDYWDCLEVDENFNIIRPDGNLAITALVPKKNPKKVYRYNTTLNDFMSGFRFYMGYWYEIWIDSTSDFGKYRNRPMKIR